MLPSIVLDKNYLQGAKASSIRSLASTHQLVMPGALFYELLTTSPKARIKCLAKLPKTDNPVKLIDHVAVLLRHETELCEPAGLPSRHSIQRSFQFNNKLLDADYALPSDAAASIVEMEKLIQEEVDDLINLTELTPSLFPGLLDGSTDSQKAKYQEALRQIADPTIIYTFYSKFDAPAAKAQLPSIEKKPDEWAIIRWLQVKMLFTTSLFISYQGQLRRNLTNKVRLRLEHDIHDAQVLVLGILEGALATNENKLRDWFRLLRPLGTLLPCKP